MYVQDKRGFKVIADTLNREGILTRGRPRNLRGLGSVLHLLRTYLPDALLTLSLSCLVFELLMSNDFHVISHCNEAWPHNALTRRRATPSITRSLHDGLVRVSRQCGPLPLPARTGPKEGSPKLFAAGLPQAIVVKYSPPPEKTQANLRKDPRRPLCRARPPRSLIPLLSSSRCLSFSESSASLSSLSRSPALSETGEESRNREARASPRPAPHPRGPTPG